MDKKVLKFYEAPEVEIVDIDLEAMLLAGSDDLEEDQKVSDDE